MVGTFSKLSGTSKMFTLEEKYFTNATSVSNSGCAFTNFTSVYPSVATPKCADRVEEQCAMRLLSPILYFILH